MPHYCHRSKALGGRPHDQRRSHSPDVDLFEKPLESHLEFPEKPFSFPIGAGDDFNLNDIVDEIHAAILPASLIGSRLGTHGERAENSDQLFANLFDLLVLQGLEWAESIARTTKIRSSSLSKGDQLVFHTL